MEGTDETKVEIDYTDIDLFFIDGLLNVFHKKYGEGTCGSVELPRNGTIVFFIRSILVGYESILV
jgi:hypothetical protein